MYHKNDQCIYGKYGKNILYFRTHVSVMTNHDTERQEEQRYQETIQWATSTGRTTVPTDDTEGHNNRKLNSTKRRYRGLHQQVNQIIQQHREQTRNRTPCYIYSNAIKD